MPIYQNSQSIGLGHVGISDSNWIESKNHLNIEDFTFDSLSFNTEEGAVTFKNREIIHLKEMLDGYIKNNHPEDLL